MAFITKPLPPSLPLASFGRLLSTLAVALTLGASTCTMATPTPTISLIATRCVVFVEIRGERARPRAGPRAQPGARPRAGPSVYFR